MTALISLIRTGSKFARDWLAELAPWDGESCRLRDRGLRLCDVILASSSCSDRKRIGAALTAEVISWIPMPRESLRQILLECASTQEDCRVAVGARNETADIFGWLAVSYARANDIEMTCLLLRRAASSGLRCESLEEACRFLLEQQNPDGSVGLIAAESWVMSEAHWSRTILLERTLDVLAAFESMCAVCYEPAMEQRTEKGPRVTS